MRQAVDRSLATPSDVLYRERTADSREVRLIYRYTPAERGQILSFVWWVYVNRNVWDRSRLKAAITSVSPLMLFSSAFLMEMTGIPRTTTQKCMIKSCDVPAARVTGTCDPWVIHQLLITAVLGMNDYREAVRELSLAKGVPSALLSRISGVPQDILRRPDRGIQFFPEEPDLYYGAVCSAEQCKLYDKYNTQGRRKKYDPDPGNQLSHRSALAGTPVGNLRATSAPVPGENHLPYHLAIPGIPAVCDTEDPGRYYEQVWKWEDYYHLPAASYVGPDKENQRA